MKAGTDWKHKGRESNKIKQEPPGEKKKKAVAIKMRKGQPVCGRAEEMLQEERAANVPRGMAQVTAEAIVSNAAVTS